MKVALAADHAGLPLREIAAKAVFAAGNDPVLVGPDSGEPVDYPDVAEDLARAILDGRASSISISVSEEGVVTITAVKNGVALPPESCVLPASL